MSATFHQVEVDLRAVNGEAPGEVGVAHGAELVDFVAAVMASDEERLARARERLRAVLSPEAFVDACAVIGAFNVVDRVADATGLPLDERLDAMSAEVRGELSLSRFGSARNTEAAPGRS